VIVADDVAHGGRKDRQSTLQHTLFPSAAPLAGLRDVAYPSTSWVAFRPECMLPSTSVYTWFLRQSRRWDSAVKLLVLIRDWSDMIWYSGGDGPKLL
jgi:hypothetical protein